MKSVLNGLLHKHEIRADLIDFCNRQYFQGAVCGKRELKSVGNSELDKSIAASTRQPSHSFGPECSCAGTCTGNGVGGGLAIGGDVTSESILD